MINPSVHGSFRVVAVVLALALSLATTAVADTIRFHNPSGTALTQWPLHVGVPFARGQRRDVADVTLTLKGRGMPTQAKVAGRWDDGSIRWASVDALADIPASGGVTLELGDAIDDKSPGSLLAQDHSDRIVVDTGPLRFEIPKREFAIVDRLTVDGRQALAGKVLSSLKADGKVLLAQAPTLVRIVNNGGVRALVEIRGHYSGPFDYVIRVEAYSGRRHIRVLHTFESHTPQAESALQQLTVSLPLPVDPRRGGARYRLGREAQAPAEGVVPKGGVSAVQLDNERLSIAGKAAGGHLSGVVHTGAADGGMTLVARWFWQQYPQAFEILPQHLNYQLWGAAAGPTAAGSGSAKTHEFVLAFGVEALVAMQHPESVAAAVVGHVEAARTVRTAAMRNSLAATESTNPFLRSLKDAVARYREGRGKDVWDDRAEATCLPESKVPERRRKGFYGMWNWGDWNFPGYHDDTKGCDAWGNLEYDLPQVMALGFAATGDDDMLEELVASARHFMDVDRIHFSAAHPSWVGMNHPKNPRHFSFELGGVDLGHTWTEGLVSYAMLTGDDRGIEAAQGIADYLVERSNGTSLKGNPRQWGWPQIALIAVYEVTGDRRYLDAARAYARGGMAVHEPVLGKDWKIGILAEALTYTHSVSGDAAIAEWLRRYAKAVAETPEPRDARLLPAVAYVGRLDHQEAYAAMADRGVADLKFGNWGKPLTIAGRTGFSILSRRQGD